MEDKLKDSDKAVFGYQGMRTVNMFEGLRGSLAVEVNPAKMLAMNAIDQNNMQAEEREIEHRIYMQDRRRKLDQMSNLGNYSSIKATPAATGLGNNTTVYPKHPFSEFSSTRQANIESAETKAKLHPIDELRDRKAYRDAIQTMLREQELDDTHDMQGNTIYTLKFDLAVSPENHNHGWGKVDLKVNTFTNTSTAIGPNYYTKWVSSLENDINAKSIALQRRIATNNLSDEEKMELFAYTVKAKHETEKRIIENNKRIVENNKRIVEIQKTRDLLNTPKATQEEIARLQSLSNVQIEQDRLEASAEQSKLALIKDTTDNIKLSKLSECLNVGCDNSKECREALSYMLMDRI